MPWRSRDCLASIRVSTATDGIRETTNALVVDLSVDLAVMLTVQHFASYQEMYARNARYNLALRYYEVKSY